MLLYIAYNIPVQTRLTLQCITVYMLLKNTINKNGQRCEENIVRRQKECVVQRLQTEQSITESLARRYLMRLLWRNKSSMAVWSVGRPGGRSVHFLVSQFAACSLVRSYAPVCVRSFVSTLTGSIVCQLLLLSLESRKETK